MGGADLEALTVGRRMPAGWVAQTLESRLAQPGGALRGGRGLYLLPGLAEALGRGWGWRAW